jgi:glutamate N-acetyltransferase/amino-acid N-acetyltransferase
MTPGPGLHTTPLPKGFYASGANSGVRRYRPDLGLIVSDYPCVAAGVFTLNTCPAAPVQYCQKLLPSTQIRAIVTNSGQANAATGKEGIEDNLKLVNTVAETLSVDPKQVLVASTGIIGYRMELDKILPTIPELKKQLTDVAEKFALAILTTDLVPKTVNKIVKLSSGTIMITGICKGSGMIHPNMATMLGYLLTDAVLTTEQAQKILKQATDVSFNMISVDNQMSTNDCVFLLANGSSNTAIKNAEDEKIFLDAMIEVEQFLAKAVARDGEGATKLLEVQVTGAHDYQAAKRVARGVTTSDLFKCAVYGEAAYWGRVIAVLGQQDIPLDVIDKASVYFQDFLVYPPSKAKHTKDEIDESMKRETVVIKIDLANGKEAATAWGCDLSERYVKINADYGT